MDISHPIEIGEFDALLSQVKWAGPDHVSAVWMNRVQNQSIMVLCETSKPSCRNVCLSGY